MFIKYFFFFIFLTLTLRGYCQDNYTINGKIKDLPSKKIWLISIHGDKQTLIDTTQSDNFGNIHFSISASKPTGIYHIVFDYDKIMEIVYNNESIEFKTELFNIIDSMHIKDSKENIILYDYLIEERKIQSNMTLLDNVLKMYGLNHRISKIALKEYQLLIRKKQELLVKTISTQPDYYATNYIKARFENNLLPNKSLQQTKEKLKKSYWNDFDFNNISLLNSEAFSQKIIYYLDLYSDKKFTKQEQENSFIVACDNFLPKINSNPKALEFALDFLVRGFEHFGFETTLTHLSKNFSLETSCENNQRKTSLEKKLASRKSSIIGSVAPNFSSKTIHEETFELNNVTAEKIILVFYASWCPHCLQELPKLANWYNEAVKNPNNNIKIIAISLDHNKDEWKTFVNANLSNVINISELKGWDSKIADDYNVYSTPTYFLLDKNKNILQKTNLLKDIIQ